MLIVFFFIFVGLGYIQNYSKLRIFMAIMIVLLIILGGYGIVFLTKFLVK